MKLIRLTGTIVTCESWGPLVEGHYYEVTAYTIRGQLPDTMLAKRVNEDYLLECTGVELSSFVDARKREQGPGDRQSGGSEQVSVSTLDMENLPAEPSPSNEPGYLGCYSDQAR